MQLEPLLARLPSALQLVASVASSWWHLWHPVGGICGIQLVASVASSWLHLWSPMASKSSLSFRELH